MPARLTVPTTTQAVGLILAVAALSGPAMVLTWMWLTA